MTEPTLPPPSVPPPSNQAQPTLPPTGHQAQPTLPPASNQGAPPQPPATAGGAGGKPWWRKWWVIALACLVVLFVLVGIFGDGDDDEAGPDTTSSQVASSAPADASDVPPSGTSSPTEPLATPAPSGPPTSPPPTEPPATPAPTEPPTTPAPTSPPTTAPPQVLEGSGDSVVEMAIPGGETVGVLTFTHNGQSNFAVWALDASFNQTDLLVNVIGSYAGRHLVLDGPAALEITADGAWRVEIRDLLSGATPMNGPNASGQGSDVLLYTGDSGAAAITHAGESNFAVWSYPLDGGGDLLVNEIGNYTGTVRFPGPAVVDIEADGAWTIDVN